MSARSRYIIKLALEQNKESVQSSCVDELPHSFDNAVINNYDIESIVDAGLIFENEFLPYSNTETVQPSSNCFTIGENECLGLYKEILQEDSATDTQPFELQTNNDLQILCENPTISFSENNYPESALEEVAISSVSEYFPINNGEEEVHKEDNHEPSQITFGANDKNEQDNKENDHPTRHKRSCPESWKRNRNKIKRMKGDRYVGYTRNKDGKINHDQNRPARVHTVCDSDYCLQNNRYCSNILKEDAENMFAKFWNLSWDEKKVYVCSLIDYVPKKRSYIAGPSRRSGTFFYQLKVGNEKLRVCKQMFLGTLGLKEKMVHSWIKKSKSGIMENTTRTLNQQKSPENDPRKDHLKNFFEILPKQPSHYCRKDSSRVYLEQSFKTKTQLYNLYKENCQEKNIEPYTIFPFSAMFEEMKLAIFKPRKDECNVCYAFKIKQISEQDYNMHVTKKDEARLEKTKNKEEALEGSVYTFVMDTQAVKLCPLLNVSASYYKTKLQVHNFTIYDLQSHKCMNYLWNETEGDLSASVFTTCILKHLRDHCLRDKKPIILFSDGCCYQNRNVVLSNALLHLAVDQSITIEQKYLEKGHTQMECDSVHALIERKLKNRTIQLPGEYISVIREARIKPTPLDVCYLKCEDFLRYDDKSCFVYSSIRPGKIVNDPTVTDLRSIKYTPEGKILYKIDFNEEYKELPQRPKQRNLKKPSLGRLFEGRIKLKKSKWLHLQQLKNYLTADAHGYYDSLPYLAE